MKVKLSEIVGTQNALLGILGQRLPALTSFRLAKIIRTVGAELDAYEQARKALCEKYGTLSEDGTRYDISDRASFDREIAELLATEVEIAGDRIKQADLADVRLSVSEAMQLGWLVEE